MAQEQLLEEEEYQRELDEEMAQQAREEAAIEESEDGLQTTAFFIDSLHHALRVRVRRVL